MESLPPADRVLESFRMHGQGVYRFALMLVRREQDAEDVVQETFLKLLRHVQNGGAVDNLRGWLFTVAANASRDRQRTRTRWLPWTPKHDQSVSPPALPDEDGRHRALRAGFASLPDRDRLLLALRAQGLSYREIASASGLRLSSVGQSLARALDRWADLTNSRQGDHHAVSFERSDSGRR